MSHQRQLGQSFVMGQANADPTDGPTIWTFGTAPSDAGVPIVCLAKTGWIAPNGPRNESIFKMAYVTVRWLMGCVLDLVVIVDREPEARSYAGGSLVYLHHPWTLPALDEIATETFKIPLRKQVVLSDGRERRYFPKATRARLLLTTPTGLGSGVLSIEGFTIDVDPVQEQKAVPE